MTIGSIVFIAAITVLVIFTANTFHFRKGRHVLFTDPTTGQYRGGVIEKNNFLQMDVRADDNGKLYNVSAKGLKIG